MAFLLLAAFIVILGLRGVRPGRRSYTAAGIAGLLAGALIYFRG